ncbi:MAG TPA: toll/interleukin-1 receptor domain-containing protein [Steroidobacteraceae bacterium]|jgi:tetratricopeptide (TPR) repeat protein
MQYRAFLSYSHRDAKWADWLHKALETYRLPKPLVGTTTALGTVPKRLIPIFRDREELSSATELGRVINAALQDSACQIVICSPDAAKSRWVNAEILAFKRLGREDRIFPLIVSGEPNASELTGREGEECFPPALRFHLGADGELSDARTEPVAADARPGKDGKHRARLKLVAAVLGVGFDVLRRRERQRRNRRLFIAACAATCGMVLTTGLATYALIQREIAQKQTVRAEKEADAALQTTNFLIGLFRLADPSEARGNTVTAREMLDKAAVRVDAELAKQPAIQVRLLQSLGTVYTGLGLYREAQPLLNRSVAMARRLTDSEADALSEGLNDLADLQDLQADYAAAEKAYREAIARVGAHATDRGSQITLANSRYGLGIVLLNEGHYAEAARSLREALALQRKLYGEKHGDIARSLEYLALTADDAGDLKSALPLMRSAVSMQRELHGGQPHPDLAEAINDLGSLLEENGDYDESERMYRESIALKRQLYGDKHPQIARGLNNLASALQDKGELASAYATYRQALEMERELLGETHPEVANTLNNIAFVQYDRGDTQGALANEREALGIYSKLFPGDHAMVASVTNKIGFWLTLQGDYPEAERDLRAALAMRRRLFNDANPDVASSLENLAILQVATHSYSDALGSARTAVGILTHAFSADDWRTAIAESAAGGALTGLGNYPEAEKLLGHSYGILRKDPFAPAAFRTLTQQYLQALHEQEHRARSGVPAATSALQRVSPQTIASTPHR